MKLVSILTIALMLSSAQVFAGNVEAGKEKAASDCADCHGMNGFGGNSKTPVLAGQREDYLYSSLVAYRDGKRINKTMSAYVTGLTDEELKDLSAFYASLRACQ